MRIIVLLCLISLCHFANAEVETLYKCQVADKKFIYQILPCYSKHNQHVLNVEKQTPEQIERAKQLNKMAKQEYQALNAEKVRQRQLEAAAVQADVARRQAEATAALAVTAQSDTLPSTQTVITPYMPYYSYDYGHTHHHNPQNNNPYPFYSPNRTGVNFSPYPNIGPQFAPYPNINPNYPIQSQISHRESPKIRGATLYNR